MAFAFTKDAAVTARVREHRPGLFGETASSDAWRRETLTTLCSLRRIGPISPDATLGLPDPLTGGFACFTAAATIATMSSQVLAFCSSRPSFIWPIPVKWPWPSMKPGVAS